MKHAFTRAPRTGARTARWRNALVGTALPVLAVLGTASCREQLTEAAQPQGSLTNQSLSNKPGLEGTLVAAYRALDTNFQIGNGWAWTASQWVWGSTTSDDALKGSSAGDQPGQQDIDLFNWGTANTDNYLNDEWRGAYEGVSRANAVLSLLQSTQKSSPGTISASDASGIAGEAIFLRAHYHFNAYRIWGNIPYYRESDSTDFRKPNEQASAVVADLIKDLDSAAVLLPATPRNGEKGRVTKWAALAYKGRVQVYAGQYAAALTTLRAVQASGTYALEESFNKVWSGFPEYWNGKETILAYQASVNDGDPNGSNANWGERLNFPYGNGPGSCCGFHQPSQNLVNFYAVDATTGLPAALTNANWNANNANFVAGSATPVDPRLDWTVGRDNVPYKDWGLPNPSWNRDRAYAGPYSPKKNVHEQSSVSTSQSTVGWTPSQLNAVKIHIFRYADMLLLLAEAEVEAGSLENARAIVNQIRARAAKVAQGPGGTFTYTPNSKGGVDTTFVPDRAKIAVPLDDPSITWATYKISQYPAFTSQDQARTAVRTERRLELAMEGQRFFDLKRWGTFQQTLNDYAAVEKNRFPAYFVGRAPVTARNLYFPIPSAQIELSKVGNAPALTQNPGW